MKLGKAYVSLHLDGRMPVTVQLEQAEQLDEPFSGLDVGSSLVLRSLIGELAVRGKTILFSSHELETVERVCSHVVILNRGRVVADDSIERLQELMSVPTLKEIFSQLAVEQDTAAISQEIADSIEQR